MNLRCFAIDDEPLALKQMCSYIEQTPFLELIGSFNKHHYKRSEAIQKKTKNCFLYRKKIYLCVKFKRSLI